MSLNILTLKVWRAICKQWGKYPVQMIGAIFYLVAFIRALLIKILPTVWFCWVCLAVVGIIDLILIYILKQIRITQWIRGLFPKYVDLILMFSKIVLVWVCCGELFALAYLLGLLDNHFSEIQNKLDVLK